MASVVKYAMNWDLDRLMPHPEQRAFRERFDAYSRDLARLAERTDDLPDAADRPEVVSEWIRVLGDYESVAARADDLESFVRCHAAADAGNATFQLLEGELSAQAPFIARIATNIELAVKGLDEAEFERFLNADERLGSLSFFLRRCREHARFRLAKSEETLAAELGVDGLFGWVRLYNQLSGDLRVEIMERGEVVQRSPGQVLFDSPERSVRENNFYAANKAWNSIAGPCGSALNHIAGTRLTLYRRLGLRDHLEVPLNKNRMTRESLAAMWSAVTERKPALLQYLSKKAEMLGLKQLCWYDLQAPLPARAGESGAKTISYDEACRQIIGAFTGFSEDLGSFARRALEGGWIEAENRPGKRQGGFCTTFPTARESRIFLTFTDTADGVSTLAHELGHAYHAYVLKDQPLFYQDYPMNLAETASTFAETVLEEQRRRCAPAPLDELSILDKMLMDAVAFLMNIHARFLFENEFYTRRTHGELSRARFDELMLDAQRLAYLNALCDDGWNPEFWISKLHFYIGAIPFYNFPYTFGYLLSLGLYATGMNSGNDFAERLRDFLVETGRRQSEDAVRQTFGENLNDRSFWDRSLDIVEGRVERFLELAG